MKVTIDAGNVLRELQAFSGPAFFREIRTATRTTSTRGKTFISKQVQKELATPQKNIKGFITSKVVDNVAAQTSIRKGSRLSLKAFKPVQTKAGVTYQISKATGKKTIPNGFMGPRPGLYAIKLRGHVFSRKGKTRLPISKKFAVSPYKVFIKGDKRRVVKTQMVEELGKQLKRRLRYRRLKALGII